MNPMNSPDERAILHKLDDIIKRKEAVATIERAVNAAGAKLAAEPGALLSWETIPLGVYGPELPETVRSSWVFILRAFSVTGAERHPNSHQRMVSYHGSGDFQICFEPRPLNGGPIQWESNHLSSDSGAGLNERWVSIPPNTWHQGVTGQQDWVVVSFHTAPERELIEERPRSANDSNTRMRTYLD